jgi:uncharacterized protein
VKNFREIKIKLESIKPVLRDKYHVSSIGIFGSVLRGDYQDGKSDVDILVDFSEPIGITFIDLADFLENQLNRKIDLFSRNGIKDRFFSQIEKEIIYV